MNSTIKRAIKTVIPASVIYKVKGAITMATLKKRFKERKKYKGETTAPFGVNLIGPIRGDFGLGESCRIVATILRESGVPFTIYNTSFGNPSETDVTWSDYESTELPYSINLIHVNPSVLSAVIHDICKPELMSRYNIAYWLWELPEFPSEWDYLYDMFDEIWTPAEFISKSIRKRTSIPVLTVRYAFEAPKTDVRYNRDYFNLPEETFLFMVSYDGNSISERKNPWGTIRAYKETFTPEDQGVGIVIKATHASKEEIRSLSSYLSGYSNIIILTDSYSKTEFNSLIKCVDVYVSLHRAEGFGLVMAEAMLLGTPTIATDWSANTEFMNNEVACMVPAEIVELKQDIYPYHKGNHWANPDVRTAGEYMRKLYEDKSFYKEISQRAVEHMNIIFNIQNAGEALKNRLYEKHN